MSLDNQIIVSGDNPNIMEIIDYIRNYYIDQVDYSITFRYTADMGVIGEVTGFTLELRTDELREDGTLRYLLREPAIT